MSLTSEIPDSVRQEVSIYLGADERIIKALSSTSDLVNAVGEVWLILTNLSLFFFTRRHGREPVVALLARKDIREIEYFEKKHDIVLTFVPERNPGSSTRLSFPVARREAIDDFCEDLASLIKFKKETAAGVKTYKAPQESGTGSEKQPQAKIKQGSQANVKIVSAGSTPVSKQITPDTRQNVPGGKDKSTSVQSEKKAANPAHSLPKSPPPIAGSSPVSSASFPVEYLSVGYIFFATCISIIVAFIWFKFFSYLDQRN